jgi:hypothetical protein
VSSSGGNLTGSLEGVREVVWPPGVRLVWFACVSGACAQVIRLEVLFSMGSRQCRGFAVPGKWLLYPCDVIFTMKSMKRHEGLSPGTWV